IWNFCGSYEHLSVPWNDEYRATVRCLCVDCGVGGPRETWQHNVRSTNASYHRTASMDGGTLAQPVCPRTRCVDDPGSFDTCFFSVQRIPQQHRIGAAVAYINRQNLGMIAHDRTRSDRFDHPLCYQALREFALRIFKPEDRTAAARVKQ